LKQKLFFLALDLCQKDIDKYPSQPYYYFKKAKVYFEMRDYKSYTAECDKAIAISGNKAFCENHFDPHKSI
jgi:hypothetical protein